MICKPILFNIDMVRAILANEKTQTRWTSKSTKCTGVYLIRSINATPLRVFPVAISRRRYWSMDVAGNLRPLSTSGCRRCLIITRRVYRWVFTGWRVDDEWATTYCRGYRRIQEENEKSTYCEHTVTHWMPLPMPPKED